MDVKTKTAYRAGENAQAEEDTLKGRYLTFPVLDEIYGVEIKYVTQIISIQKITEMPEMPVFMKGIINLRGRIVPVIDIRLRFNKPEKEYDDRTCVIIIDLNGQHIGLITDSISEVMTIDDEDIEPLPDFGTGRGYIKGIGKKSDSVVLLIDCQKLLSDTELESISL
jgi:purine-binding chemotaxis protein CheW